MKVRQRFAAGLLALVMAASLALPAGAAEPQGTAPAAAAPEANLATGQITAALRLDYAQTLDALQNHNVRAALLEGDTLVGDLGLWDLSASSLGDYSVSLQAKNAYGEQDNTGWPKYLELSISGLPRGSYTLRFTGLGYKEYSHQLVLEDCSRQLTVATGNATFTLGDVNADGKVDATDRELLSRQLASSDPNSLSVFDFNGDGKIDVTDLAYVNSSLGAEGSAQVTDGALLAPPVDFEALAAAGLTVTAGKLEDIFTAGGSGATLSVPGESLSIPIDFSTPVEVGQLSIVTPENGGIETGKAQVEYVDGTGEELEIGQVPAALSAGVFALSRSEASRTITLNLGKRVAVKKITIIVDRTPTGTVTLESVQFLKEIAPDNPTLSHKVSGLAATAGSASVSLKWRELPNVTGYKIEYWPDGSPTTVKSLTVSVPYAQVTDLENLKTYWFQVTPTSSGWEGQACDPVSATPQPAKAPNAPDMVSIQELDGALGVSWKKAEGATYYQLFYKEKDAAGDFAQAGGQLLSPGATISGLKNGTTYSVYVVAGNEIGKSGPSRTSEGTPKAVNYEAPEGLPKAGLLDRTKIRQIRLADPNNVAAGEYPANAAFRPDYLIDGDYRTHWTAKNWYGNEHVITTFTQPVSLQAVLWVPRLDGQYPKNLRAYSIQVWYEGEDTSKAGHLIVPDPQRGGQDNNGGTGGGDVLTWPNIPNRSLIPTSRFAILPFGPAKNIIQISVAVEQADYNLVSCSELLFMEYDPAHCLPEEIGSLFADQLRTQLKPGVTQATIDALRTRLSGDERFYYIDTATLTDELNLAQELLSGSSSGVILNGVRSRSGSADSSRYAQGGSELQALGAASQAGKEITIYAQGIPAGGTLKVFATQFNAEASAWRGEMGTLENGRNTLAVPKIGSQNTPRGGSLYFTYTGPNPESVSLHVRRATDIPVLQLDGWYTMTEAAKTNAIASYLAELDAYVQKNGLNGNNQTTNCLNVTEISTPTMLLSLPALAVKNSTNATGDARVQALFNSVLAWEDIMHICKTAQGIDKTYGQNDMQTRQNIRCMQMFSGAFMYAAGNHIGIGYGSCAGMAGGRPISATGQNAANSLFGWGIAHEIGHNMDKLGRAEITNNIYSLLVQTYDGGASTLPSRLENSNKYPAIFQKTAMSLPGESNNVFVQLGMYWQLHLAYDSQNPLDFYNRFFKAWKAGTYTQGFSGLSYDEKVALTAAGTVQKDLTQFFTRWGMRLSDAVKTQLAKYPEEPRALWYLSDQSRRDRLANKQTQQANFTANAALKPDSNTEIQINIAKPNASDIQGYEILRDGQSIAFVASQGDASYTDVIGSGNHLSFTYTVKAYSTLGEVIGETSAGQVRVAYDKTIDPDQYVLSRTGDTITFTLKEETAVSGLKLLGVKPEAGELTVTITGKDGKTNVARQGSFGDTQSVDDPSSYVTYFNKPGTNAASGTIWTYDAKIVTVAFTGLSQSIADGNIQLISYAGDDVSFLPGTDGFIGRLSADYDAGEGNVIPAGTLVVVGTYRGDPYYSSLRLKGKFTTTNTTVGADGSETVNTSEEIRDMAGEFYLFAQVPEDKKVSDISDGLFLFVPDVQKEAELQESSHCDGENLLPSEMQVELYRLDDPTKPNTSSKRMTSNTLWVPSPGGQDLPTIVITADQ